MATLFFEAKFIDAINQTELIPLAIVRYMFPQWLLQLQRLPNNYQVSRITRILLQEGSSADLPRLTQALEHLFRTCRREAITNKQLAILLKENTILSQQRSQLLAELYESYVEGPHTSRIEGANKGHMEWSAISLRQTRSGEQTNRMYMKVQLSQRREGKEQHKTVTMTLVEFRLFWEQIEKAEALLS